MKENHKKEILPSSAVKPSIIYPATISDEQLKERESGEHKRRKPFYTAAQLPQHRSCPYVGEAIRNPSWCHVSPASKPFMNDEGLVPSREEEQRRYNVIRKLKEVNFSCMIVKGPPVMVSDAISPAIEGQTGNFDSDWCPDSSVPEIVSSPDDSDGNVTAVEKPVWNKPSNGVFDTVSPVMGAVSWPSLGESKNYPKASSSESLKALADAPLVPALQVVTENLSSSPRKPTNANNKTPASAQNDVAPGSKHGSK
ncbi:hypothetical protein HanPI659440_Chr03g0129961 [Helianthus annuus]|nr:hypothetical protein HanPI659440_Chr03g0129961 [Helianthus annuus]